MRSGMTPRDRPMSLLREPFVHFVLLGALIFGAQAAIGGEPEVDRGRIVVDDAVVESIVARWRAVWQRPPSVQELRDEVEQYVRRQVLYREGLAMGLDQDDIVIQRRLAQKVEFLAADLADTVPLEDEELRAYYREHPERYTVAGTVSFRQVLFAKDRRGDRAGPDAELTLARLRAGELADFGAVASAGDPSLLPVALADVDEARIRGTFGGDFAEALLAAHEPGWLEPIPSGYGVHLVEVRALTKAELRPFEDVEDRVRDDVERARREGANAAMYRRLREKYQIVIDTRVAGLAPGLSPDDA